MSPARRPSSITVGLIAAGLAFGTACSASIDVGSRGSVNTDKAATEIADGIAEQTGIEATVTCPDDVEPKADSSFTCTAKGPDGREASVYVTQKDDEGNVTWEMPNTHALGGTPMLNMDKVVTSITDGLQQQLDVTTSVERPSDIPIQQGHTFSCDVTASTGESGVVHVEQQDDHGNVTWNLE